MLHREPSEPPDTSLLESTDFPCYLRKHDRRTDGPMDGRTDRPCYRDETTHLKRRPTLVINRPILLTISPLLVLGRLFSIIKSRQGSGPEGNDVRPSVGGRGSLRGDEAWGG